MKSDFLKKKYLGVPASISIGIIIVCLIGLIVGSFSDYSISEALSNKTAFGEFFAHYGNVISFCFYPIAGTCLLKGFQKKGPQYKLIGWGLMFLAYFLAVYYSNYYYGKYMRADIGYVPGESPVWLELWGYCIWILLYSWVPPVTYFLLEDKNPNLLIAIGAIILIAGILSNDLNQWLKNFASRPRYKYLLTLDNPEAEFRQWWEVRPYFKSTDEFESFPSGHMTKATLFFCLPMLADVIKVKKTWMRPVLIAVSLLFVLFMAYNRISMQAHFLTDVSFAVLITYLCFLIVYIVVNSTKVFD